jgi:hypothetical protein
LKVVLTLAKDKAKIAPKDVMMYVIRKVMILSG